MLAVCLYPHAPCPLVSGILPWHHLKLYNHPGHSLSSGESDWDLGSLSLFFLLWLFVSHPSLSHCLASLSFSLSPTLSQGFCLCLRVTPVMDEFEHGPRLSLPHNALWFQAFWFAPRSHRSVPPELILRCSEPTMKTQLIKIGRGKNKQYCKICQAICSA